MYFNHGYLVLIYGLYVCFRDLNIPAGDGLMSVKKTGIALLCHLDRLGSPLLPPLKGFVTVSGHKLTKMMYRF